MLRRVGSVHAGGDPGSQAEGGLEDLTVGGAPAQCRHVGRCRWWQRLSHDSCVAGEDVAVSRPARRLIGEIVCRNAGRDERGSGVVSVSGQQRRQRVGLLRGFGCPTDADDDERVETLRDDVGQNATGDVVDCGQIDHGGHAHIHGAVEVGQPSNGAVLLDQ